MPRLEAVPGQTNITVMDIAKQRLDAFKKHRGGRIPINLENRPKKPIRSTPVTPSELSVEEIQESPQIENEQDELI